MFYIFLSSSVLYSEEEYNRILDGYYKFLPIIVSLNNRYYEIESIEEWDENSISIFISEHGYIDDDSVEDVDLLFSILDKKKKNYGYDDYIYVPPQIAGVQYGAVIWLKKIGVSQKRKRSSKSQAVKPFINP